MFSSRLPPLAPNAHSQLLARLRAAGIRLVDLTISNPTAAGIPYPPHILSSLADPRAREYVPEPFGLLSARGAIAEEASPSGTVSRASC
jgi:hypothetical protein